MNTMINTRKAAEEVYEAFWDSYLIGDMKTMASFLADDFKVIGSTEGEIFYNKKETMKYYEATADQIAGKTELRNRNKRKECFDGLIVR